MQDACVVTGDCVVCGIGYGIRIRLLILISGTLNVEMIHDYSYTQ